MNNDLISRSALLEQTLVALKRLETGNDRLWEMNRKYHAGIAIANSIIINAPAVDAEVVRHGRWISENIRKKSYLRQCSVCNKIAYFCGTGCSYNYCPNCGAKMDGEHNDIQRV